MAIEQRTNLNRRMLHRLRESPEFVYTNENGRWLHGRIENNGVVGENRREVLRFRDFQTGPDGRFLHPGSYGGGYYDLEQGLKMLDAEAIRQGFTRKLSAEEVAALVATNRQRRATQMEAAFQRNKPSLV